ncbi:hypothetical protein [Planktothrix paucivesiculata]|uniref:Uncharacterized protein n=1 Tax=Planktothrix paucivesiculata PCC 9631 TaxID=671071 RepID=A0A7Z9DVP5_9CYAN|nr:hypothetical protein [Planktothrix paucivesiculata]VXD10482.1 hypothetical protein PL9631_100088 [Planktothrix paucivesiculata PCC 9631]
MDKPKFCKGQKVGVYSPNSVRIIYEVDKRWWTGASWVYNFVHCDTKKPVYIYFSNGGFTRYQQQERWLRLEIPLKNYQ